MKVSADIICKHEALQKNAWQSIYLEICEDGFHMHIKVLHQRINCVLIESTTKQFSCYISVGIFFFAW